MISLTNHDSQWGRSEVVIIYPEGYHWPQCFSQKVCMLCKEKKFSNLHNPMVDTSLLMAKPQIVCKYV